MPSGASAGGQLRTTRAEFLRCLGEVSSQPEEEMEGRGRELFILSAFAARKQPGLEY